MEGIDSTSSGLDLGGEGEVHKAASYSLVDGGGGAVHREVEAAWKGNTGGSRGGKSVSHVRSLHELEWREEKEVRGSLLNEEACERPYPQKKKGGGGSDIG